MTREEVKQICQIYDNLRRERDAATIVYNSDDTFWDHILTTYNLSQPSLPSNLDETAEEHAYKTTWDHGVRFDSFKTGAEWMAEQGYTFETIMQEDDVDELVPTCPDMYNHGYSCGDKVIVQIRKKQ